MSHQNPDEIEEPGIDYQMPQTDREEVVRKAGEKVMLADFIALPTEAQMHGKCYSVCDEFARAVVEMDEELLARLRSVNSALNAALPSSQSIPPAVPTNQIDHE